MANILDMFSNLFSKSIRILTDNKILIGVLLVIFIIIGIVFYSKYVAPKLNKTYVDNREFVSKDSGGDNTATLYFFYTDWCPLSKKAEPEWKAFKEDTGGEFNGITMVFREIDCDHDVDTADRFKINGYPTIKLVYGDKVYEYDAKPDRVTLAKFLNDIFKNP